MVGCAARREVVEFIKTRKLSERCGCALTGLNRKSHRYRQRRKPPEKLTEKIRQLAMKHPSFGYRRIWALLSRDEIKVNLKKVYRLWKQEKLALPKRKPRKRRAKSTIGILPKAEYANQIWTYDFVFDQSLSGKNLKMLRSDNGSEFIGRAVNIRLAENGIKPLFIEPGKPWQNGKGESFNGKLRDECLSREWFSSVREAQVVIEKWRKFYNDERPHSSLEYLTPSEFKSKMENTKSLAIAVG